MVRVLLITLLFTPLTTWTFTPPPDTPQTASFVGAEGCRDCHAAYFKAWSATKHARALGKLSGADKSSGKCTRCHVTDTAEMLAASKGAPKLDNVQCEACHGAARAHADAARAGNPAGAKTTAISEATCTRCHNPESPHYKTFIYAALAPLVHRVQ